MTMARAMATRCRPAGKASDGWQRSARCSSPTREPAQPWPVRGARGGDAAIEHGQLRCAGAKPGQEIEGLEDEADSGLRIRASWNDDIAETSSPSRRNVPVVG